MFHGRSILHHGSTYLQVLRCLAEANFLKVKTWRLSHIKAIFKGGLQNPIKINEGNTHTF